MVWLKQLRSGWVLLLLAGVLLAWPQALPAVEPMGPTAKQADTAEEEMTEEERQAQREADRQRRLEERDRRNAEAANAAQAMYDQLSTAYLTNDWAEVARLSREARRHRRGFSREQRANVDYITRNYESYRPDWWDNTSRTDENSFEAEIWGREFWANYYPTDELGLQAVIPETRFNRDTGEVEIVDLKVIVTWKPHLVDNEDPAGGRLSKMHDFRMGDLAEFIIWHELGHNYITENVPMAANIELYEDYSDLYSTLHEYFADLTALYHCSPRARRVVLMFRLTELDAYDPNESHRRGEHAIGAILLADMLENPDAWPSVHFPPAVPQDQIELNTIIYIYEHLDTEWSVAQDTRLREFAEEYIMEHGERTFRSKGEVRLPNRLTFNLMAGDDREDQAERDQWVKEKLEALIASGRADTLESGETYEPPTRSHLNRDRAEEMRLQMMDDDDPEAPLRIKIPW